VGGGGGAAGIGYKHTAVLCVVLCFAVARPHHACVAQDSCLAPLIDGGQMPGNGSG